MSGNGLSQPPPRRPRLPSPFTYPTSPSATFPRTEWNEGVAFPPDLPLGDHEHLRWAARAASTEWIKAIGGSWDWRNIDSDAFKLAVTDVVLRHANAHSLFTSYVKIGAAAPFTPRPLEKLQKEMLSVVPAAYQAACAKLPLNQLAPSFHEVNAFATAAVYSIPPHWLTIADDQPPARVPIDFNRLGRFNIYGTGYFDESVKYRGKQPAPFPDHLGTSHSTPKSTKPADPVTSTTPKAKRTIPDIQVTQATPLASQRRALGHMMATQ